MNHEKEQRGSWSPVILFLVCSATVIELALQGADLGLWGPARLRIYVYQNSAFWPGLLGTWIPNYEAQPYTMFVTYAFVHGGLAHLIINMITLVSLGNAVIRDVGQWRVAKHEYRDQRAERGRFVQLLTPVGRGWPRLCFKKNF